MKPLITAADLERVPQNGEVAVTPDTIITPLAREEAERRGITFRMEAAGAVPAAGAPDSSEPEKSARIVAIAADHGGFELKELLKGHLRDWGYQFLDLGTDSTAAVDYPDFAEAVARAVVRGDAWLGVVLDSAGIGSSIAANKVPGARAALCYDRATARNSREHNDANVLTLGAKLISQEAAREILAAWLATPFAGGRHQRRVDKIRSIEERSAKSKLFQIIHRLQIRNGTVDQSEFEQVVRLITEEVVRYLGSSRISPPSGAGGDDEICADCDLNCAEKCARKTRAVVDAGADRISCGPKVVELDAGFAGLIDHTLLKPEASRDEIRKLCQEAAKFGFASVCINPWYVPLAAELLRGTKVKVCTVVGFPLGATLPRVKIYEAEETIKLGAQEIDMVINIGALKSGQDDVVQSDIRGVVEASHRGGAICKVILETALLTVEEKVRASIACKQAGADFVKTSTGFSTSGATAEDVALMRAVVGSEIGVKAAGGVRSFEDLKKMVCAGATRIGASASVKIMEQVGGAAPTASAPAATSY
jgi:deoxyribose-phosphate aldolase